MKQYLDLLQHILDQGSEKADRTGAVSYDPGNHHRMTELRRNKIRGIADDIPEQPVIGEARGA